MKTTRFTIAGGGVALATASCWALMRRPAIHGIDDANIYMSYARSLANGHGFVFTPGGEPVEGGTSFLWTVLAGLAWKMPGGVEVGMFLISLVLSVATVWLVGRVADAATEGLDAPTGGWGAWTAGALVLFYPYFVAWNTLSLMDMAAWVFSTQLLLLTLIVATNEDAGLRPALMAGLAVILCVLTRPEALAFVPAVLLLGVAVHPSGLLRGAKALALPILAFILAQAGLTLFRLLYFGYPLPNTYYAKVPPALEYRLSEGVRYLSHGLYLRPELLAAVLLAALVMGGAMWRARRETLPRRTRATALAAGTGLALLAVVVGGGGDHFGGYRFLQPAVPPLLTVLVAGLAAAGLARMRVSANPRRALALTGVMALWVSLAYWTDFREHQDLVREMGIANHGRALATALNEVLPGHPSTGVITVGGFGLTYEGRTYDLLGLNWTAMGHSPGTRVGPRDHAAFNADVLFTAVPDVMLPEFEPRGGGCPPRTLYMRGLESEDRFRSTYVPGVFASRGSRVVAYFTRSWMDAHPGVVQPMDWEVCGS